jgi:hypothetical protein
MLWVNLGTMCGFLANSASGIVLAILKELGVYPKAAQAHGQEDYGDEAWIEGSSVPDEFRTSRPVKDWRHGHGFAIAVEEENQNPYLVCFASGLAKWSVPLLA